MNCLRCHGLMLPAVLYSESECLAATAYSCINCGEYVDALILQNRLITAALVEARYAHASGQRHSHGNRGAV